MRLLVKISRFFLLLGVGIVLSGCSPPSGKLVRLAGSTAFAPFAEQLAEVYMEKYPGKVVDVQAGGSAVGIMAAVQGIVDIGMADVLTLPKEADPLARAVVAKDGIAVIVNEMNPVDGLSMRTLTEIFSGRLTNWEALGWRKAPIRVISREEGSGTRKSFDKLVLGKKKLTSRAIFQDSNGTIREVVKSDPDAIGYISIGFLVPGVKPLAIDGVAANNDNVVRGTYPLARPVYFLFQKNPPQLIRDFLHFVLGKEAQTLIAQNGLISIR